MSLPVFACKIFRRLRNPVKRTANSYNRYYLNFVHVYWDIVVILSQRRGISPPSSLLQSHASEVSHSYSTYPFPSLPHFPISCFLTSHQPDHPYLLDLFVISPSFHKSPHHLAILFLQCFVPVVHLTQSVPNQPKSGKTSGIPSEDRFVKGIVLRDNISVWGPAE